MTKLLSVRHGHVEGIEPARFRGREELVLTETGVAEAAAVARHIARMWNPIMVYTSPLSRCVQTGRAIAGACHIPSQPMPELYDIDYGTWQFRTYAEMKEVDPVTFAAWFAVPHLVRFPRGESLQDLVARAADALRIVIQRHAEDTVVLVAHDSVNRALLLQLLDQPLSSYWRLAQSPACINEIDVSYERIVVRQINVTAHLQNLSNEKSA